MRDLVRHKEDFDLNDVSLLKVGRHFRLSPEAKAVIGRGTVGISTTYARIGDVIFLISVVAFIALALWAFICGRRKPV